MSDPDVFNSGVVVTTPVADPVVTDPFADKLRAIVGADGKPKYANTQVALDALLASQTHIARLEAEKAQERAEIERLREVERNARSLDDIVERLKTNTPDPTTVTTNSGVDEKTITTLLTKALEERDRQSQSQANLRRVNDVLTEKFKDKAPEVVATKAAELGMSPKELGELSSRNPQLVLQLFGTSAPAASPSPTTTSIHFPSSPPASDAIKMPEKSVLGGVGATTKNQKELMAQIRAKVLKDLDVTT